MNKTAKIVAVILAIAVMLSVLGCTKPAETAAPSTGTEAAPAPAAKPATVEQMNFATSTPGGANYSIGGGLSAILNDNIPGYNFTVESTGGAVENMRLINAGEAQLCTGSSDVLYAAVNGIAPFDKDGKLNVQSIGVIYDTPFQIATMKNSGIKTVADLEGKKLAVGLAGSHVNTKAKLVCDTFGFVDGKNITWAYLDSKEGCQGLIDGTVDAVCVGVAIPAANLTELALSHDITLISFSEEEVKKLTENVDFFTPSVVPAGTYNGVDEDIQTFSYGTEIGVSPDLPEELVYQICKVLFQDEIARTSEVHKVFKNFDTKMLTRTGATLHPGAVKFYKELGIL